MDLGLQHKSRLLGNVYVSVCTDQSELKNYHVVLSVRLTVKPRQTRGCSSLAACSDPWIDWDCSR